MTVMPGWEMKIIEAEARRLLALAAEDADLRAELRALAHTILAATEPPQTEASRTESSAADEDPEPPAAMGTGAGREPDPANHGAPQADQTQEPDPLHELTLGRSPSAPAETHQPAGTIAGIASEDAELDEIAARCRLKAEATRLAAARLRQTRGGDDPEAENTPGDPEVAAWADRFAEAFYWLDAGEGTQAPDIALLDDLEGCFEALAEASTLAAGSRDRRGAIARSLHLLAEAQSAVRAATRRLQAPDDPDQLAAYDRVREAAARHRVYIKRYLRADDLADPARWPDLLARIEAQGGGDPQARRLRPRIERLRRHLEAIRRGEGTDRDWQEVVNAVDQMVSEGLPPSSKDMRDLLLPVIDDLPDGDDLPEGFRMVLREIDNYLASRSDSTEAPGAPEPTAEVLEARRLLGARSVILIGGMCRPEAREALREALSLGELIWVETKEHQAVSTFEPAIARPEVAVVLLAIRWSSHAFGEVRRYCDRHGKPLVRLPGGYNPNQVAAQVVAQCGERLRGG